MNKITSVKLWRMILILLPLLALTACAGTGNSSASTVVEAYFQAIVDGNEDRIATLSCSDWESSARADVAAFYGVTARLEAVSCREVETNTAITDGAVVVECDGAIVATYNNEDSTFELAGRQFKVSNQDGEWLVCGYAE